MYIVSKCLTPRFIENHLKSIFIGLQASDKEFALYISENCDMHLWQNFMPPFGYTNGLARTIFCPRSLESYDYISQKWHCVIGELLPFQDSDYDYESFRQVAKDSGCSEDWINSQFPYYQEDEIEDTSSPKVYLKEFGFTADWRRGLTQECLRNFNCNCFPIWDLLHPNHWMIEKNKLKLSGERIYYTNFDHESLVVKPVKAFKDNRYHNAFAISSYEYTPVEWQQIFFDFEESKEIEEKQKTLSINFQIDWEKQPKAIDAIELRYIPTVQDILLTNLTNEALKDSWKLRYIHYTKRAEPPKHEAIYAFLTCKQHILLPLTDLSIYLLVEQCVHSNGTECVKWLSELARSYTYESRKTKWEIQFLERSRATKAEFKQYKNQRKIDRDRFVDSLKALYQHNLIEITEPDEDWDYECSIRLTEAGVEFSVKYIIEYLQRHHSAEYLCRNKIKVYPDFLEQDRGTLRLSLSGNNQVAAAIYKMYGLKLVDTYLPGVGHQVYISGESRDNAQKLGLEKYVISDSLLEEEPSIHEDKSSMEKLFGSFGSLFSHRINPN